MFNLLIVKLFEKSVFVLRTELMVWENGPTKISYIMLTIEKTAIEDSYLTLLLVFVIGIFLLISCNCFVGWQKGLSMMKVERAVGESDHQTITG